MKKLVVLFAFLSSINLHAKTQKAIEALNAKKVIENEKFLVLSEDTQEKKSFYLVYGEYNFGGSIEAEYVIASYDAKNGLKILIRDQALFGMLEGKRKASVIPMGTREKLLLAYGAHRTPLDSDCKTFKAYIAEKLSKNKANLDEKWLYANLKAPSNR